MPVIGGGGYYGGYYPPVYSQTVVVPAPTTTAVVETAQPIAGQLASTTPTEKPPRSLSELAASLMGRLRAFEDPMADLGFTPVINATGVILHTNLGRASWPRAAIQAALVAASQVIETEAARRVHDDAVV